MGAIKLAVATGDRAGIPNSLRTGTVVSVSSKGVTVDVAGGSILCSMVGGAGAGVAPGATVSVFKQGDSWQVQGVVVGPGQGRGVPVNPPLPSTNAVVLPPIVATVPGSILTTSGGANLIAGLASGSGTVTLNFNIENLWPKGHLLRIVMSNFQCFSPATANFSTLVTVRENGLPAGTIYATYEPFNPVAGNGTNFDVTGWVLGDGAVHTIGAVAAALTGSGSITIVRPTNSFFGILDYGDASGVTLQ